MHKPEQKCALRALNMCDGSAVHDPVAGRPRACLCEALERALVAEQSDYASELRTARARAVARAPEYQRKQAQRAGWMLEVPRSTSPPF